MMHEDLIRSLFWNRVLLLILIVVVLLVIGGQGYIWWKVNGLLGQVKLMVRMAEMHGKITDTGISRAEVLVTQAQEVAAAVAPIAASRVLDAVAQVPRRTADEIDRRAGDSAHATGVRS